MKKDKKGSYDQSAKYYDYIYHFKNYEKESKQVIQWIKKYLGRKRAEILEVGCGTGNYIKYLRKYFHCSGLDNNKHMLQIAKNKFKDINFYQLDMIHFELGKQFDAVLCLFSSIGYTKTYANLTKALVSMHEHVRPGGMLILEPFLEPENYKQGSTHMNTYSDEKLKLVRMSVSKKRGILAVNEMHYMVAEKDKKVEYFQDKHELALFDHKQILQIMKNVGFKAKFLKRGLLPDRGVFIGIKE